MSVVIPTYDRLPLLREAVASVRAQTVDDWELIVVDDGSGDGTAEWVEGVGDPRVRVLRRPHTGNVAALRNAGVAEARGRYVAFLDSDDLWEREKLQAQLAALHDGAWRWCCTAFTMVDERGLPIPFRVGGLRPRSGAIVRELLAGQAAVCICTWLVERALLLEAGGFAEELEREDFDLGLRLVERAPVLAVPDVLVKAREHPRRRTAALDVPHEHTLRVYLRFLARERDPGLRAVARRRCAEILVEGARYQAAAGRRGSALRMLLRALRYGPAPVAWARALARVALPAAIRLPRRSSSPG